ncbi:SNARE associated Golgi protein [Rhodobacteraceae bacterium THAF1]|uniref:YqaA family protein n=1 Tax=Palleronia sp. THAF1 TaxID=2587842 RepID=UPI000F3BDC2B|nr:DedA family protein [Palleronia sp. THAF1]QFU09331.1 SNARE associated Golgi protein [Palleronia sp. THAF1]VDC26775.1 SNARE associated Golgi protein [Rhodobacteraceae bacterium THAF1]
MTQATDTEPETQASWTERLARHRTGLAALSFAESTVLPIPLETIIAPLMIGHPKRSITIAVSIWLGCLFGASLFYLLGLWLRDPVVLPIIEWLSFGPEFEDLQGELDGDGLFWTVFLVSFSPAPMQLATLGAGAVGGNFLMFFAAIAVSRGVRYFGLALLAQLLGERIEKLNIPKRKLVPIMAIVLACGYLIYRLLPI